MQIKLLFDLIVIFANPPRFIKVSYSGKMYFSPTGTRGAPCPPNLILNSKITNNFQSNIIR